jgi:hypothetical protein
MNPLAIAKLSSSNGETYLGSAFAVSKFLAITAYHCVGDRERGGVHHKNVKLRWLGGDLISRAEFVAGDKLLDYALLELRPPIPDQYGLQPLGISRHPPLKEAFRSMGFISALHDDVVMPTVHGSVSSYDTKICGGAPAIQLYCDHSAARLKLAGLSGAPAVVAEDLALGMIRWNPPSETEGEGQGGMVFATSMITIMEERPLFFRDVRVFHLQDIFGGRIWLPG